jgi:hypothetical protein
MIPQKIQIFILELKGKNHPNMIFKSDPIRDQSFEFNGHKK